MMKRLALLLPVMLASTFATLPGAVASEHTSVMSSADDGDPFDGSLSLKWDWQLSRTQITREFLCNSVTTPSLCPGGNKQVLVKELDAEHRRHTLNIEARIGLYHDLELFATFPFVVSDVTTLDFPDGVAAALGNSSIVPPTGSALFAVPNESRNRTGFGDMQVGLRYAPLAQWRQPAYPTLRLALTWTIPTGEVRRADTDGVGLGLNQLRLEVTASRRMAFAEPYFGFWGNLKFPSANTLFVNYNQDTQKHISPGHDVGILVGTEFFPWDNPRPDGKKDQYFSIDVGFSAMYTFQGRDYTDLFDALGTSNSPLLAYTRQSQNPDVVQNPLVPSQNIADPNVLQRSNGITDVAPFGTFTVWSGFNLQPVEFFELSFRFTYTRQTAHLLTMADVGQDLDGGMVNGLAGVNFKNSAAGGNKNEYNPVYASEIDDPGKRLRSEGTNIYGVMVMLTGKY